MSKRIEKKKKAEFSIGSEGFSVHTMEIRKPLTYREYRREKGFLYDEAGHTYKEVDKENIKIHVSTAFVKHGVHKIRLIHRYDESAYDVYLLEMVINPRKLLDPASSYLGIFEPSKKNVQKLINKFKKLFQDTEIESDLDGYQFSRIDLCVNIHCDKNKIFRELVRVLRKLPTPPKYERLYRTTGDRKEDTKYNKHYIKFHCGTHDLVIYDKTYQMEANGIIAEYEKLPNGVLRIEMCCFRTYLRKKKKKERLDTASDFLWYMIRNSGEILTDKIALCFPHWRYMRRKALKEKIDGSHYSPDKQEQMITLIKKMQRKQSFESAFTDMKITKEDGKKILDRFEKLGISPVPLRENFCADELTDLAELLEQIVSGKEVEVFYTEAKYR